MVDKSKEKDEKARKERKRSGSTSSNDRYARSHACSIFEAAPLLIFFFTLNFLVFSNISF